MSYLAKYCRLHKRHYGLIGRKAVTHRLFTIFLQSKQLLSAGRGREECKHHLLLAQHRGIVVVVLAVVVIVIATILCLLRTLFGGR